MQSKPFLYDKWDSTWKLVFIDGILLHRENGPAMIGIHGDSMDFKDGFRMDGSERNQLFQRWIYEWRGNELHMRNTYAKINVALKEFLGE